MSIYESVLRKLNLKKSAQAAAPIRPRPASIPEVDVVSKLEDLAGFVVDFG